MRDASTTFNGVVNAADSASAPSTKHRQQDEPNTADDNDARVDDGNDRRLGRHSHHGARQARSKKSPNKKIWNAPSTGVIAVKRKNRKNPSPKNQKLSSAVEASRLSLDPPAKRSSQASRNSGELLAVRDGAAASRDPSISEVYTPKNVVLGQRVGNDRRMGQYLHHEA